MATDLSTVAGGLKRVYDSYIEQQQNLKARSMDEISKSLKKYSPDGEGYFGAINDYGNESVGAISETEAFRTIDNENYLQWKVVPKVLTAPIEFGGLTAAAAQGDEASFANLIVDALDKARDRLMSDENRQFFGIGTGLLASPTTTGAITAAGLSFTVDSTQYLRKNQVVDIFSGATKTVDSYRISYVDRVNSVVGFLTSIGVSIDSTTSIIKENIRDSAAADGKEMMGLRGIVDDGTDLTTFQNITTSVLEWRSRRINASSANLTSDLLQRLIDDVDVLCGEEPDMLIMHKKQRRKYLDLVVPQKRYQDGAMDTGFTKLSFNGTELFLDKDCQTDTVYAINKKKLRKFELEPMGMGRHEGSDTFLRKVGTDTFQAYWRHYCNFGTSLRRAHGKIVSLAVSTGLS
jgi:hypothetical protein